MKGVKYLAKNYNVDVYVSFKNITKQLQLSHKHRSEDASLDAAVLLANVRIYSSSAKLNTSVLRLVLVILPQSLTHAFCRLLYWHEVLEQLLFHLLKHSKTYWVKMLSGLNLRRVFLLCMMVVS